MTQDVRSSRSLALGRFAILTYAGLADVARKELAACDPENLRVLRLPDYDLITCDVAPTKFPRPPKLTIAEDVFYMMGRPLPIETKGDASRLDKLVTPDAILKGLELKNSLFRPKKPKATTYNCFVKQDRDRPVRRRYIADRVSTLIASHFPRWRRADPAAVELWGFYVDQVLHLGFRLSDNRMRYRGREPALRKGALRPTIAAAVVHIADPQQGELVVDPMCGTGTILQEGLLRNPDAQYLGGDAAAEAVALAASSLSAERIPVLRWDATNLPLRPESVHCVVCNLPFGKQYSTRTDHRVLYRALLSDWIGGLTPDGRMVLLTSDTQALEHSLGKTGLAWSVVCKVKVLGVWARIYRAERRATQRN
jgi:tRNA G10  N-methylase Trm11